MTQEDDFLRAIRESPGDAHLRSVYADFLEDQGQADRAELVRVCEAMRRLPVFSDEYWRLKARRNELRSACPADWLAATGCDGSRYDPVFRDGIPKGWKGRWRLIREFTERWHGIPTADVGGRRAEVRAEQRRLGLRLPPSLREYVAYAHDVAPPEGFGIVHRDVYTMRPIQGQAALSVMMIAEGNVQWAVRDGDLRRPDPPVHTYYWVHGDETRYIPAEVEGPESPSVTEFVLGFVTGYKPDAEAFNTQVRDAHGLREQMDAAFAGRVAGRGGLTTYEGDGVLAWLRPALHGPGLDLTVSVHPSLGWERVPAFLWGHARHAHSRSGMFLSEEDRRDVIRDFGGQPPPWLGPAPPPLRDLPPGQPPVWPDAPDLPQCPSAGPPSPGPDDDIPF